jgi:hypothetical protein
MKSKLFTFICLIFIFQTIYCEVVCSEDELRKELLEDLADNGIKQIVILGMLDCLRESSPIIMKDASGQIIPETPEQEALRIKANWDGDCSFEAEGEEHWKNRLIKYYGIKWLVDVKGNPMTDDAENQADMCEIIRALIANSKMIIYL